MNLQMEIVRDLKIVFACFVKSIGVFILVFGLI